MTLKCVIFNWMVDANIVFGDHCNEDINIHDNPKEI